MQETLHIGGKDIRLDVYESGGGKPAPAIVLLHGSGGNVGFWTDRLAPHVKAAGVSLFAPHYFDRTGIQRADHATITDGVHVPLWIDTLRATLDMLAARPGVDPKRIALVGVSLGAFLSLGFAAECSASQHALTPCHVRCIVDVSGGLVEPFRAQATPSFPPTLILHGAADRIVPVSHARDLDARLTELGVDHTLHILPGEDHWFTPPAQMKLLMHIASFFGKHLLG
jgi:carboxymethylenebutenolidase